MAEPARGRPRHPNSAAGQRPATTSEYGVLGVAGVDFTLDRVPPSADLVDLVERHWLVSWDLPPGRQASVTLLPHPCVNLVFDRGQPVLAGVGRDRFTYTYTGRGRVFGTKFRPGGFRPFLGAPLTRLTGRTVPLTTLWDEPTVTRLGVELSAAPDLPALVEVAERALRAYRPAPDPRVAEVGKIVHALLFDREITRVEQVGRRFGRSPRSLQRLFGNYVGVSPKWVLRRYRLHEAAARLADEHSGDGPTWAQVATELGYFDQSHFIRDFTRAVGMTPVSYADACRQHRAPLRT